MPKVIALISLVLLASCGVGPHKRILTRPGPYDHRFGFPSTGDPVDINALVREYPELKGKVITAAEYMEEYEKWLKKAQLEGRPFFEFRFMKGTSLDIEVVGEPELSKRDITVNPDGFVYYPYLGKVVIEGKKIEELRNELELKLSEILRKPQVLIHVKGGATTILTPTGPVSGPTMVQGGDIILMGAVRLGVGSQNLQYTGRETLIRVLGLAGVPANAEWRNIVVLRRDQSDPLRKARIIICDLWAFLRHADVRQDIPLFPGDVVYVPFRLSIGEQIQSDWALMLSYIGGIFTLDQFKDSLKKGGSLRD